MNKASLIILIAAIIGGCSNKPEQKKDIVEEKAESTISFIEPPIAGINIPYTQFEVTAEKGGTLNLDSGSKVIFPPNAFVDADGKIINGKVTISFREFQDPLAFYVAGIPMQYNLDDKTYTFESSAMCEIKAMKDNVSLGVNPNSKPKVSLVSKSNNPEYKAYYLDTIQKNWVAKENANLKAVASRKPIKTDSIHQESLSLKVNTIPEPKKASGKRPILSIDIPYVDMIPELKIFKDTEFEIDESEKNYNPIDADKEWDDVKLSPTATKGVYQISFRSPERTVTYRVKPVYQGKSYDEALKVFKAQQDKVNIEKVEQQNRALREYAQEMRDNDQKNSIRSSFEIDKFGYWNCDRLFSENTINIYASYTDENGKDISLKQIYHASKGLNALFMTIDGRVVVMPNSATALWTVSNNQFYYYPAGEFEKLKGLKDKTGFTFKMHTYKGTPKDYAEIKKLLEL